MSKQTPQFAIVILAAGASKRMGKPKQNLTWGNTTLLGHTIEMAKKVNNSKVHVVLGAYSQVIGSTSTPSDFEIIKNDLWQHGLGTSIAAAVNHISCSANSFDGILFILGDQPFITSEYLNIMINSFVFNNRSIVATLYKAGEQGVPVLFDAFYQDELLELKEDQGAKYLLKKYKLNVKSLKPPLKNVDLDTEADYLNALKIYFNK